jgi:hypothetical protein
MKRIQLLLLVAGLSACADSFLDDRIAALGPEAEGFPPGETHRPGSPCVFCHSAYYGAEPRMSVGGTLFVKPADGVPFPAGGYTVRLVDSEGQSLEMESNRCGNFYAKHEDFVPKYPMRAELLAPDPEDPSRLLANRPMASRISRDGSCGSCHAHPPSPFSPGVVFVVPPAGSTPTPPDNCPPPNYAAQPFTDRP